MDLIKLSAGPINLLFDHGGLRYIRLGEREVLRRIYVAIRDRYWNTIEGKLSNLQIESSADSFRATFEMRHQRWEVDFSWRGTISGDEHGTIVFKMEGEAQTAFLRNRIGICVLHPIKECAGRPCDVEQVDGQILNGRFPLAISPRQPFLNLRSISYDVDPGSWPGARAKIEFEGDVFEMEDQRNWTDGSFKTYSTPLTLPFPVGMERGSRVDQSVTLTLDGVRPSLATEKTEIVLSLGQPGAARLPEIGLGAASHQQPLSAGELEKLRSLHPAHLRVDLTLSADDFENDLERAAKEAAALDAKLEIALFLTDHAEEELGRLRAALQRISPSVCRWLIFHENEKVTSKRWVELAFDRLNTYDPLTQFGSGTNIYFTELNRQPPPVESLDIVCYSINPQCHAVDDLTLMENLEIQGETVRNLRELIGDLPLAITPVTLKPRFNPNEPGQVVDRPANPPRSVDPRQKSALAAAWTLGSLKYLAESGVQSVTFYETTGERGVMEGEEVYPVFHTLAEAGKFVGGGVIPLESSHPLKVIGLALEREGKRLILVANLTAEPLSLKLVLPSEERRINLDPYEVAPH